MSVDAAENQSPSVHDVQPPATAPLVVSFATAPDRYRHWRLDVEGEVAFATLTVDEDGALVPGYELRMNSYDLGVDIELYDLVQRLRFEHPGVKSVVMTSGLERMFCAGANIRMLAQSSHSWKVNFCKLTNETRNAACVVTDGAVCRTSSSRGAATGWRTSRAHAQSCLSMICPRPLPASCSGSKCVSS